MEWQELRQRVRRLTERLAIAEKLVDAILDHKNKVEHYGYPSLGEYRQAIERIEVLCVEFKCGAKDNGPNSE